MKNVTSSIVSEFETIEEAKSHELWFCKQVENSINDQRPCVPHDQVMAEIEAIIGEAERNQRKLA